MKYRHQYENFANKAETNHRLRESIELATLCADMNDERGMHKHSICMRAETSE
jgi:hypothetical protein